ncbi:sigma-54-dependent Fis family transcriptional regulator [Flammeovirga pectinis]|uniref:Sigma-54-dependent Fis family transcriptional regulator n=1 Tax=Flammeovirga pectinis TaxID=2494373 RepID=A0A3Q9FU81_9BACT|nr:sigma-54 dependent transcriptional regulator [Flammeovirga pectinis]AZQ65202.1 sigma-54-dependent Fis family transcriptional regulator [Flammeovirga pectinis]
MSKPLGKILVIDDNEDILLAAKMLLKKNADLVQVESNPGKIPFLLKNDSYDVILLDMNFTKDTTSGKEGFHWLEQILEIDPSAVVVMITAYGDVETAVNAVKQGATDFVLKPWNNEKLIATLTSAVRLKKSYEEVKVLKEEKTELATALNKAAGTDGIVIGDSPAMKKVFSLISKVAKTDANILVLGENGTGKEVIARAIHEQSLRNDKVFIGVDMGSISETLFQSELFGHKKGAFTDAREDRAGRFEIANKGTLFLDEIGNLPMTLQSKLLTVLQKREVIRVGDNKQINVDIRLICATNMPVYEMVESKEFRQDLLYRINTVEIHLPPLRDRLEDIPLLVTHFLNTYTKKYRKDKMKVSSATMKKLQKYYWPGNVRELQHALERAVIMAEEDTLQPTDFTFLVEKNKDEDNFDLSEFDLDTVEKMMIQKAVSKYSGNISKAAKSLGLTRASLYRRLEKHGL